MSDSISQQDRETCVSVCVCVCVCVGVAELDAKNTNGGKMGHLAKVTMGCHPKAMSWSQYLK